MLPRQLTEAAYLVHLQATMLSDKENADGVPISTPQLMIMAGAAQSGDKLGCCANQTCQQYLHMLESYTCLKSP